MGSAAIDWEATAAMGQAIGSVVAIAAAIWIDQGTVRRQRKEKAEARAEAVRGRLQAIDNCVREL
jgi:hypothetical protein